MDYCSDNLADCQSQMHSFWDLIRAEIDHIKSDHAAFKTQDLPLARIKKIMKLDDDIKSMMISAEAPILFAKAAELFIRELTLRAWIHTERNRRRTLQRNDIAMAVSDGDTDQFDFLIDIVPREEARGHRRPSQTTSTANSINTPSGVMKVDNNALHSNAAAAAYMTTSAATNNNTNGTTLTLDHQPPSNQVVLANDTTTDSQQNSLTTTVQFASLQNESSPAPSATTTSSNSSTAAGAASTTAVTAATAAAALQYVLQLPVGAGGNATGHPFQIQVFPPQFQTTSTDAISSGNQPTTLLTDANGNAIPLVQVVSQPGSTGLALPILQDSNGSRTRILQLQMPEASTGLSVVSGC